LVMFLGFDEEKTEKLSMRRQVNYQLGLKGSYRIFVSSTSKI
jgi:hypothetical protein